MAWFGYINHNASCYMDSVLVALFAARHHQFFYDILIARSLDDACDESGKCVGTPNDLVAPLSWRQSVQRALAHDVAPLQQSRTHGHACTTFRSLLGTVPRVMLRATTGEEVHINFAAAQQQSAVDFLHYLFDALCAQSQMAHVQHSTTFMLKRPEVVNASLSDLACIWKSRPIVKRFTAANAHELEDESERRALRHDTSGEACIIENDAGDRRRISAPEPTALFSCHLVLADNMQAYVDITRGQQPHAEFMHDIEGYRGPLYAKMVASRVKNAPVVVIEVSRKVDAHHKLKTPVMYGGLVKETGQVVLNFHGRDYMLTAVVCHVGGANNGHYIAYVCAENNHWYLYDDAHRGGELMQLPIGAENLESMGDGSPSRSGELFFYTEIV